MWGYARSPLVHKSARCVSLRSRTPTRTKEKANERRPPITFPHKNRHRSVAMVSSSSMSSSLSSSLPRPLLLSFCAVVAALAFSPGRAAAIDLAPSSAFAQYGSTRDTYAAAIGLTWDWNRRWSLGSGELSGYWEAALGRWKGTAESGSGSAYVTQFGITPVFRWRPDGGSSPWFYEAGIGVNALMPVYRTERKQFSTVFNFGDHLAVGRSFGAQREHELALRVQHFSNAGIKEPNPGETFLQLRYVYRLR